MWGKGNLNPHQRRRETQDVTGRENDGGNSHPYGSVEKEKDLCVGGGRKDPTKNRGS